MSEQRTNLSYFQVPAIGTIAPSHPKGNGQRIYINADTENLNNFQKLVKQLTESFLDLTSMSREGGPEFMKHCNFLDLTNVLVLAPSLLYTIALSTGFEDQITDQMKSRQRLVQKILTVQDRITLNMIVTIWVQNDVISFQQIPNAKAYRVFLPHPTTVVMSAVNLEHVYYGGELRELLRILNEGFKDSSLQIVANRFITRFGRFFTGTIKYRHVYTHLPSAFCVSDDGKFIIIPGYLYDGNPAFLIMSKHPVNQSWDFTVVCTSSRGKVIVPPCMWENAVTSFLPNKCFQTPSGIVVKIGDTTYRLKYYPHMPLSFEGKMHMGSIVFNYRCYVGQYITSFFARNQTFAILTYLARVPSNINIKKGWVFTENGECIGLVLFVASGNFVRKLGNSLPLLEFEKFSLVNQTNFNNLRTEGSQVDFDEPETPARGRGKNKRQPQRSASATRQRSQSREVRSQSNQRGTQRFMIDTSALEPGASASTSSDHFAQGTAPQPRPGHLSVSGAGSSSIA